MVGQWGFPIPDMVIRILGAAALGGMSTDPLAATRLVLLAAAWGREVVG